MRNYKTDISVYCTCGERLYGPGSSTDFKENASGDLQIDMHIAPCPQCGTGAKRHSSAEKTFTRAYGFDETVRVG